MTAVVHDRLGRYELTLRIGQGGMAEVYLARLAGPEGFVRDCVIKRMLPALQQRPELVELFLNEARITAQLVHPHIVQAFDLGQEDGSYFLALELVEGVHLGQLAQHIARASVTLPIELAVYIVARAADGLHFAHELRDRQSGSPLGIVHRDVSPQNLLVSHEGDVKVSDFGIAQQSDLDGRAKPSAALGKLAYMSPEQAMGSALDRRSDVYSLGVVLHELLVGRPLVRGADRDAALAQVIEEETPVPSRLAADVDSALDAIVAAMLQKSRSERLATAGLVAERLDAWLATRNVRIGRAALGRWMKQHAPDHGATWQVASSLRSESSAPTEALVALEGGAVAPVSGKPETDERTTKPRPMTRTTGPQARATSLQTPPLPAPSLPQPKTRLIGRRGDLDRLAKALSGAARLLTLVGPGGTGKTRLLLRLGELQHAEGRYVGGVLFADLTEVKDLDGLTGALARAAAFPLTTTDGDPIADIGAALRPRNETLLLVDNVEQIEAIARTTFERLLAAAPQLQIVASSRVELRLPDERVHEVVPLRLPSDDQPLDVEGPLPEAVELFVDRARAARTGWVLQAADAKHVVEIVRALDGIPLAIELAAARIKLMSAAQIKERLPRRFDLLRGAGAGHTDRQATLRGAIDWSWNLLSDDERRVLVQVANFRGGFSLDALLAVVELPSGDVLEGIEALRQKSFVYSRPLPGYDDELRFGMYETIRAYVIEQRQVAIDHVALRERHRRFFVEEGLRLAGAVDGLDGSRALARLAAEQENLLGAHDDALAAHALPEALDTLLGLEPLYLRRGPYATFLSLLGRAIDRTDAASLSREDRSRIARLLMARGETRRLGGRLPEARLDNEAALAIVKEIDDRALEGRILSQHAVLAINLGDLEEAEALFQRAIALHRVVGDRLYLGRSLGQASTVSRLRRRLDEAEERCAQALPLLRELGDRRVEGRVLVQLANVYLQRGRLDDARREARRSVGLLAEVGDQRSLAYAYGTLGSIELDAGRLAEAEAVNRRAIQLARTIGDRRTEGVYTGWLGAVRHEQRRLVEACELYGLASAALVEAGDRSSDGFFLAARGTAHATLGLAHRDEAELAMAEVVFREAERKLTGSKKETLLAAANVLLAYRFVSAGDRDITRQALDAADAAASESDEVRFAIRVVRAALSTG